GLLVVGVDREKAGVGFHALHHDVAPAGDLGVLRAAEHDLDRLPAAADQAATHARLRTDAGQRGQLATQLLGHLGGTALALVPVLQEDDHVAGVHFLAGAPAAGHAGVVAADRGALAGVVVKDLFDLAHLPDRVVEARTFRPGHRDEEGPAILRRGQLGRDETDQAVAQRER